MTSQSDHDIADPRELAALPDGLTPSDEKAILISLLNGASFTMVGSFVIGVLASVVPIRLADPLWLIGIITAILSHAGYALTGFVLLHLAVAFAPDRLDLQERSAWASRLAVPVALGFLLLIPLQGFAVWRGFNLNRGVEARQQDLTTRSIQRLRQEIAIAPSIDQLQSRLRQIQAPPLTDADRALPLPQLKRKLLSQLSQAETVFLLGQASARSDLSRYLSQLLSNLRFLVLELIFAFGFAAGARRGGQTLPLIEEWLLGRHLARDRAEQRRQARREQREQRLIERMEQIERARLEAPPSLPAEPDPVRPVSRNRRGRHGVVDADYFETIFSDADGGSARPEDVADQRPAD